MTSIAASPGAASFPSSCSCARLRFAERLRHILRDLTITLALSLSPPPTALSELKKRSRHGTSDSFELARSKRYRGLEAAAEETAAADAAKDVPKYTQRHVEFFEQAKLAEIARVRCGVP